MPKVRNVITAFATSGETSTAILHDGGATVIRPKESQEAAKLSGKVVLPPPRDHTGAPASATPRKDYGPATISCLFRQVALVFHTSPTKADEKMAVNVITGLFSCNIIL